MSAKAPTMRVVTFNLRYDNPGDGPDSWKHRRESVVAVLKGLKASVFGCQEALWNQMEDLIRAFPEYGWVGVGRDDAYRSGEFSPIFYRKDQFHLHSSGTFWLSETPDQVGTKFASSALPRICTWARLDPLSDSKPFFHFNTHFDHISEEARNLSSELILRKVSEIAGLFPAILTGDLNCTSNSKAYNILQSSYFRDTNTRFSVQRNSFVGFHQFLGETIDFIFTSGFEVTMHDVHKAVRIDCDRNVSDHLPVVAELRINV